MTTFIAEKYLGNSSFEEYPFELSDFQKNAIDNINSNFEKNNNIINHTVISAPTGSGKTLPAEHAIIKTIKNGGKVIYTGPVKTLQNYNFKSFSEKFADKCAEIDVGILTGDIKFNPEGNVLVMTTEILKNLLFNNKIQDVTNKIDIEINISDFSLIIFDEIHYMWCSKDRGSVWETCFILLPKHVQLIMLSATMENPVKLCDWLVKLKDQNVTLCQSHHRVVPLRHAIYTHYLDKFIKKTKLVAECEKYNNNLCIFSDENNPFNKDTYQNALHHIKKTNIGLSDMHVYFQLINYLTVNNLTPSIFFCFSRLKCEKLANKVQQNLLSFDELSELKKIINTNLRKCDNFQYYENNEQFIRLLKCLEKGVAYHHSGLLPVYKELVETLFKNHLVKVLFATETFAIGVNMPTKTVVFTSLEKYSSNDFRLLRTDEYLQMGGRAGRRGMDKFGLVILLPNIHNLPTVNQMKSLITGSSPSIVSRFTPEYQLILKIILNNNSLEAIFNNSLLKNDLDDEIKGIKKELELINIPSNEDFSECEIYYNLINPKSDGIIGISRSQMKKNQKKAKKIYNSTGFKEKYSKYEKIKTKIDKKNNLLNNLKGTQFYIKNQISNVLDILYENGYLDSNSANCKKENVTIKGIIASEINECNEIILTEMIINNLLDNLNYKELGSILSLFGDSKSINRKQKKYDKTEAYFPDKFKSIINFIENIIQKYTNLENFKHVYINSDWTINYNIIEATDKWLNNCQFREIIDYYDLFDGNLAKDFVKIYNLAAEVEKIAKILNKPELEIEANKLKNSILRDEVNIESLYVK